LKRTDRSAADKRLHGRTHQNARLQHWHQASFNAPFDVRAPSVSVFTQSIACTSRRDVLDEGTLLHNGVRCLTSPGDSFDSNTKRPTATVQGCASPVHVVHWTFRAATAPEDNTKPVRPVRESVLCTMCHKTIAWYGA